MVTNPSLASRTPARHNTPKLTVNDILTRLQSSNLSADERVLYFRKLIELGNLPTIEPLLPLILNLDGAPYSLKDHFPFAPMFYTTLARKIVYCTARQVSKSTSVASSSIAQSVSIANLKSLFVLPLFEQVRRFSNNYVRKFIEQSPCKQLLLGSTNQILQRSFRNNSTMMFNFAFIDANRIRGTSSDFLFFDEIQDFDPDLLPIIAEVLSHSPWSITRYTGTPKTFDNAIHERWTASSQAEWFIPCQHCTTDGHRTQNIPSVEYHAMQMIGPMRNDISEARPATLCWKCRQPIYPRQGRWVHRYPERRGDFDGYHIPQIIMPIHYSRSFKWAELLAKQQGAGNTSPHVFVNEILGESYDTGAKLVTESDLKNAAVLPFRNDTNRPSREVLNSLRDYHSTVLAFDWGGGGQEGVSFTTAALLGFTPTGIIDVLWGTRLHSPNDHLAEARQCYDMVAMLNPSWIAHDYTGAGTIRETFLVQAGVPISKIIPIAYVSAAVGGMMTAVPSSQLHPREHYRLDKTRSLLNTVTAIKTRRVRFFQYDYKTVEDPGLMRDFLSLIEEKVSTRTRSDIYMIKRGVGSDDFAQAVNIGCASIWNVHDAWPNFVNPNQSRFTISQEDYDRYTGGGNPFFGFDGDLD